MGSQFEVDKAKFQEYQLMPLNSRPLVDGEIRVNIDFFAFTANNLTYAVAGDMLGYWQFFPASSESQGMIPVWGFADVVESNSSDIEVGERIYGYLPPASELVLKPHKVRQDSWFDASAHRQSLPPLYNRYLRLPPRSDEQRSAETGQALLGPLYMTGYLLYDYLKQSDYFGAEQVLVLSASSKTSIGLAYALTLDETPAAIGLTSSGNQAFVDGLGYYDSTVTYDDLNNLDIKPSVVVDMAGNAELRDQLAERFGDHLRHYVRVGLTHWDQQGVGDPTGSGANGAFFFAPSYMLERSEADPSFAATVQEFVAQGARASLDWLQISNLDGLDGLASVYLDMCQGRVSPKLGLICTM
ncbi:MAG: DUF2855 family protein [Pseudomonadota bacterium]